MRTILVLGYLGLETNQLDGQTVKTRDLYRLLQEKCGRQVRFFDTQSLQSHKNRIWRLWRYVAGSRIVVYVPAHNNLTYIFPILFLLSKVCHTQILYFVVGGWLVEFLRNKPLHRWMLKRIRCILPETELMCKQLQENYGLGRVRKFPNFRFTNNFVPQPHHEPGKLHVVFCARVNRMKGLDVMFELADYIQKNYMGQIDIDFWGPLHEPDKDYFFDQMQKYSCTRYRGVLSPEHIAPTLSQYDVAVLPTHFYTEGLPGTVIDAYMAGIPIIVSKWKHAEEFVQDGVTGFVIPFEHGDSELRNKIDLLYHNEEILQQLKLAAYQESRRYTAEYAWDMCQSLLGIDRLDDMQ